MQRFLFVLILLPAMAWAQDPSQQLQAYLEAGRTGGTSPLAPAVMQATEQYPTLLSTLQPYLRDSLNQVKYRAYSTLSRLGQNSPSLEFRQQVVGLLLEGVKDPNISNTASQALTRFAKEDFSRASKDVLYDLLVNDTGDYIMVMKLVGYLDMVRGQEVMIANLLAEDKLSTYERWGSYVALARLGEPNAVSYLSRRLQGIEVNDDIIYDVFPDLAYTRQREVVDIIVQTVMSDDTECSSANNDSDATILCAYRAMEFLPGVIEEFPWQRDITGDLEVDNYEEALTQIRQWLVTHPDYTLDRSGFE